MRKDNKLKCKFVKCWKSAKSGLSLIVWFETKYTEWNKSTHTQTNTINSHYVTFIRNPYSLFLLSCVRWKLRTDFRFIVYWLIFFVVFYVILKQNEEKLSICGGNWLAKLTCSSLQKKNKQTKTQNWCVYRHSLGMSPFSSIQ